MSAHWPRLSVACALLPRIRQAAMANPRMAPVLQAVELYPIVEDGLFGYELAPMQLDLPFVIIGCMDDAIPRVRRTWFNRTMHPPVPRLAAVRGRLVRAARIGDPAGRSYDETLCADWNTAVQHAAQTLAGADAVPATTPDENTIACDALENALVIASLELAEWDPAIGFAGVPREAGFGFPLDGDDEAKGTLTMLRGERWRLRWRCATRRIAREWPLLSVPDRHAADPVQVGGVKAP